MYDHVSQAVDKIAPIGSSAVPFGIVSNEIGKQRVEMRKSKFDLARPQREPPMEQPRGSTILVEMRSSRLPNGIVRVAFARFGSREKRLRRFVRPSDEQNVKPHYADEFVRKRRPRDSVRCRNTANTSPRVKPKRTGGLTWRHSDRPSRRGICSPTNRRTDLIRCECRPKTKKRTEKLLIAAGFVPRLRRY